MDWKNWEKFYFLGKEERALFNRALNRRRRDNLRDRRLSNSEFCREVVLAYCNDLVNEQKQEQTA